MGPDFEPWHHPGPPPFADLDGPFVFAPLLVAALVAVLILAALWSMSERPLAPRDARPVRNADRLRWVDAVARHQAVARGYADVECDAMAALRLPALVDVRLASTACFVEAFAAAGALLTERYPGVEVARRLIAAVEAEQRAWAAAVAAAERFRDARFAPAERALLEQARTLLAVVGSSAFEPERHTALRSALRRLSELERLTGWRLPAPAVLAVERQARGALLPSPSAG